MKSRAATATAYSAALSFFFLLVYGACNSFTALRSDVGIWCYQWEHLIPFVPWAVIPYLSLDLFFIAAPFLCRDKAEMRTLALRIITAISIAAFFFLLMPLQSAFIRPAPSGIMGPLFSLLHFFDHPYNLFPSLHITLGTILWAHYIKRTRPLFRRFLHLWFALIALSTLLTWQHHSPDLIGGFALAILCLYLFPDRCFRSSFIPDIKLSFYYLAGSLALSAIASLTWPIGAFLLWPAISMGFVAFAYYKLGPGIYRKQNGKISLTARLVLAPVLVAQYLSWTYYRARSTPWNKVTPNVWIGARLHPAEAIEAVNLGVTAVLDLTSELSEIPALLKLNYLNIPTLDLAPLSSVQLEQAVEFITAHAATGKVFVHCKAGYSRSAAAIAAYLLRSGHVSTVEQALTLIRGARPEIVIRPEVRHALHAFHHDLSEKVALVCR
jgi:protein-tyrosine phosphatase